jgi:hypothetical protein
MTELPLLARALLWVAKLLTPASDRSWIDAMRGDLDAAPDEGRALSWAFGCLIAAVRFRGAATTALTPRRRQAVFLVFLMLLLIGSYLFFFAIGGVRPHHAVGYLIELAPILVIVAAIVWLIRRGTPIVVDDRWVRRSLSFGAFGFILMALSLVMMFAGGRFGALATVLSSISLPDVCSLAVGTLATLTTAILLGVNFRSLPLRIPRVLPFERTWVFFWGADRGEMLARVDAGAPDTTFPRLWLVASSVTPPFLLVEGLQFLLTGGKATPYFCTLAAVLCVSNMLYVIAHVRFARSTARPRI